MQYSNMQIINLSCSQIAHLLHIQTSIALLGTNGYSIAQQYSDFWLIIILMNPFLQIFYTIYMFKMMIW